MSSPSNTEKNSTYSLPTDDETSKCESVPNIGHVDPLSEDIVRKIHGFKARLTLWHLTF